MANITSQNYLDLTTKNVIVGKCSAPTGAPCIALWIATAVSLSLLISQSELFFKDSLVSQDLLISTVCLGPLISAYSNVC